MAPDTQTARLESPPETTPELRRALGDLGAALRTAGYTQTAVNELLGLSFDDIPRVRTPEIQRHRVDLATPLGLLVGVFLVGMPIVAEALAAQLPGIDLDALAAGGVLEARGSDLAGTISIVPYADLLIAGDRYLHGAFDFDHAPPVTPSSRTVLWATPRASVGSVLDIGAGCGLQAVAAASHAGSVLGTDINPRALRFLQLSAALNGQQNVEVALGALLDPVAGQRFDLVVSNPPYIIAPSIGSMYEHNGLVGDDLTRILVQHMGEHLPERGLAVFLCSWAHREGDELGPLAGWAAGTGCDVLVSMSRTVDALRYIEQLHVPGSDPSDWIAYFTDQGIEQVAGGLIYLRRRREEGHPNWVRSIDRTVDMLPRFGDLAVRIIAGMDVLETTPDAAALLARPYRKLAGLQIDQTLTDSDGAHVISEASIWWPLAGGVKVRADPLALLEFDAMDGSAPIQATVDALAAQTGLDVAVIAEHAADFLSRLLAAGMVEPVD